MNTIVSNTISGGDSALTTVTHAQRQQLVVTLRGLLKTAIVARKKGSQQGEQSRAQGYADGFMRCLELSGVATAEELLEIVAEARRGIDGPATGALIVEDDSSAKTAAA